MENKLIFVDLETAGVNPKRNPIIQIAAVAVDSRLELLEAFEVKVQFDERHANKNSLRKNHFHRGIWAKEALSDENAAKAFADFLRRHATVPRLSSDGKPYFVAQLVAHNAAFDSDFLWAWFERLMLYLPARHQSLCTMQRALWFFEENPNLPRPADFKLATLCSYFGVNFHAASAHEALADVTATLALYRRIVEYQATRSTSRQAA